MKAKSRRAIERHERWERIYQPHFGLAQHDAIGTQRINDYARHLAT
jgi:hypothetical protein